VYQTTIALPDYQSGTPPYETTGGTWQFDASGAPILQRMATANVVVTVPRTPAPSTGYPLMMFVRTGGGGDRPLVDRGQRDATGMAIVPGEGPARYLARAGFAGIQFDGPLGGRRNPNGADEQFLMFNVGNLGALRDNVRQSAVELAVVARFGATLQLDASACTGATAAARFDEGHIAIMGHSMGAWIAPLAAAHEPLYRALVLSGAGGSWIANIMHKVKPVHVLPVIAAFVQEFELRADDPVMTLAQWALEAADPQVYGAAIVREPVAGADPKHVLMAQGLVDNYILPRIANSTSLAMGLDLAGPERDTADDPRLAGNLALGPLLPLIGRAAVALPASGNVRLPDGRVATAVVTQHVEDGLEDGHEVLFQTDVPKHQYQCFLASWLTGTPSVPTDGSRDAPCP
jgi:pimeloyl-ACP methyl ester carboxylesterase